MVAHLGFRSVLDSPVTTTAQLSRAVQRAAVNEISTGELAGAFCQYVDFLREAGVGPEQMLIAVKRSLGFDAEGVRVSRSTETVVIERMITRCIRQYFRDVH
jgi:hypothetical protein